MKRVLIFAMLLLMGRGAFAQGGLTIINTKPCELYISMSGIDIPNGDFPCMLNSPTFVVGATTTVMWNCVWDFQGPGSPCSSLPAPIGWATGLPIPATSLTFQWSDAAFQFKCPVTVPCPMGGRLSDCSPLVACTVVPNPWVGPCWPGFWAPVCGGLMSNVTITF